MASPSSPSLRNGRIWLTSRHRLKPAQPPRSELATARVLSEVECFGIRGRVGMGGTLALTARVLGREPERLRVPCRAECANGAVAEGALSMELPPLAAYASPDDARRLWQELSTRH